MMPTKRTWRDHTRRISLGLPVPRAADWQYRLPDGAIRRLWRRPRQGSARLHHPADARRLGDPSRGAARVLDQRPAVLQAPEQKAVAALLRRAGHAPVGLVASRGSPTARRGRSPIRVPGAARSVAARRAPAGCNGGNAERGARPIQMAITVDRLVPECDLLHIRSKNEELLSASQSLT